MKHEKKASTRPGSQLTVTASVDEMLFLEELVKHLADTRNDKGYSRENVQLGWKAIDTSSIEAYVSGNIIVSDLGEPVRLSYVTGFLFTCIREDNTDYSLEGSFSLS